MHLQLLKWLEVREQKVLGLSVLPSNRKYYTTGTEHFCACSMFSYTVKCFQVRGCMMSKFGHLRRYSGTWTPEYEFKDVLSLKRTSECHKSPKEQCPVHFRCICSFIISGATMSSIQHFCAIVRARIGMVLCNSSHRNLDHCGFYLLTAYRAQINLHS